jgi:hypothetical protein
MPTSAWRSSPWIFKIFLVSSSAIYDGVSGMLNPLLGGVWGLVSVQFCGINGAYWAGLQSY